MASTQQTIKQDEQAQALPENRKAARDENLTKVTGSGPSHLLQSKSHADLLNIIDKLRDLGLSQEIQLPQLIVCGDQSTGKRFDSLVCKRDTGLTSHHLVQS